MEKRDMFPKTGFGKPGRRGGIQKSVDYIVFFLLVGYLLPGPKVFALETTLDVSAGYDDNPAEVSQGDGSGMTRYRADLSQLVLNTSGGARMDLFLDAVYSQYFDFGDNYWLQAGAAYYTPPWHDRIRIGMFADGAAYRDELVAEDEYNRLLAGAELQWLVNTRLSLSLQPTFSRVDYRNPVSLPGQRIFSIEKGRGQGRGAGGSVTDSQIEWTQYSREDTVWATELAATYAVSPDIQADLIVVYRDLNSSDDFDSFREAGVSGKVCWYYSESGEVYVSGAGSKLDYDAAPEGGTRSDDVYEIGLGCSQWLGVVKLSVSFDRTKNDSPVAGEEYEKSVVLCGVSYTF